MKLATKLLFTLLLSSNAYAVTNGTSVNWNDYQDMVEMDCTGTVIAGKFILTAAHCTNDNNIRFSDNTMVSSVARVDHLNWDTPDTGVDVSLWTLPSSRSSEQIHYFANLTNDISVQDQKLKLFGFGSTNNADNPLHYATVNAHINTDKSPHIINGQFINQGQGIEGDSGGAWLNVNNEIVAVVKSGYGDTTFGTNLFYAKNFILENINGWHYPTLANTSNGSTTIKVQSLHDPLSGQVNDMAYTSGEATITGGTCFQASGIQPFSTCTYIVESQGTGTLHLSDSESITIKPTPESGGGDSGGSLGFLSLIGLLGLGLIRKK